MDKKYVKQTIDKIMKYLGNHTGPGIANMNEITPNIYCSNYEAACNIDALIENRICIVICLGDPKPKEMISLYRKNKINHIAFEIQDDPRQNLADVFMATY